MARRIHFLLSVSEQQNNPIPWKTYKIIRKRTVKRCLLAISLKWQKIEERLSSLRKDWWYETAVNIFLNLLQEKKWISSESVSSLQDQLLWIPLEKKDFEIIVELLTGFNLTVLQILESINWRIDYRIEGYGDSEYAFIKRLQKIPLI
jgi:hypothetical protein